MDYNNDQVEFPQLFDLGKTIKKAAKTVGKGVTKAADTVGKGVKEGANDTKREVRHEAHTIEHGASHTATQAANKITDTAKQVGKDIDHGLNEAVDQAKHWATQAEHWADVAGDKVKYIDGEIQQLEQKIEDAIEKGLKNIVSKVVKKIFQAAVGIVKEDADKEAEIQLGIIVFSYDDIQREIGQLIHYAEHFPSNIDQLVQMVTDLSPDHFQISLGANVPGVPDIGVNLAFGIRKEKLIARIRKLTNTNALPGEPTVRENPPVVTPAHAQEQTTGFEPHHTFQKDALGLPHIPRESGAFPGGILAEKTKPPEKNLGGVTLEPLQERYDLLQKENERLQDEINEISRIVKRYLKDRGIVGKN